MSIIEDAKFQVEVAVRQTQPERVKLFGISELEAKPFRRMEIEGGKLTQNNEAIIYSSAETEWIPYYPPESQLDIDPSTLGEDNTKFALFKSSEPVIVTARNKLIEGMPFTFLSGTHISVLESDLALYSKGGVVHWDYVLFYFYMTYDDASGAPVGQERSGIFKTAAPTTAGSPVSLLSVDYGVDDLNLLGGPYTNMSIDIWQQVACVTDFISFNADMDYVKHRPHPTDDTRAAIVGIEQRD